MKTKTPPPVLSNDASDFLATLLWVADSPDEKRRPFRDSTVHDFSAPFIAGVESFIDGFREFLSARQFDLDRLDGLERSFGGNVFFSLSGHGCGFFDESDSDLGDELQALIKEYGGAYRFEELEDSLAKFRNGKIDLAIMPEHLPAARAKLFTV